MQERAQERAQRPSRLVRFMARWALMLGVAGTLVGATALHGVLLRAEQVSTKYYALLFAAVLLSLSFVLAPFVRRMFGLGRANRRDQAPRTLLDEMRAAPDADAAASSGAADVAAEPAPGLPQAPPASVLVVRLITLAYVIFAAMLLAILWALQTT